MIFFSLCFISDTEKTVVHKNSKYWDIMSEQTVKTQIRLIFSRKHLIRSEQSVQTDLRLYPFSDWSFNLKGTVWALLFSTPSASFPITAMKKITLPFYRTVMEILAVPIFRILKLINLIGYCRNASFRDDNEYSYYTHN